MEPQSFGHHGGGGGSARQPDMAVRSPVAHGEEAVYALYYTVRGMATFLKRPHLWVKVICPMLVTLVSTIVSLSVLFGMGLRPQAHLFEMLHWPGWICWMMAVICVLVEVSLINLIILLVLFGCVQSQIMRSVLEEKGILAELARENGGEVMEQYCYKDVSHSVGFLLLRLPLLILTLPLNAIPVAGQIAWVLLNGWIYAWELESEFLVMLDRRFKCSHQFSFVKGHFGAFATFGAAAMGLELIPFVGPWVFFATNACGAALLAERFYLEKKNQHPNNEQPPATAPEGQE